MLGLGLGFFLIKLLSFHPKHWGGENLKHLGCLSPNSCFSAFWHKLEGSTGVDRLWFTCTQVWGKLEKGEERQYAPFGQFPPIVLFLFFHLSHHHLTHCNSAFLSTPRATGNERVIFTEPSYKRTINKCYYLLQPLCKKAMCYVPATRYNSSRQCNCRPGQWLTPLKCVHLPNVFVKAAKLLCLSPTHLGP